MGGGGWLFVHVVWLQICTMRQADCPPHRGTDLLAPHRGYRTDLSARERAKARVGCMERWLRMPDCQHAGQTWYGQPCSQPYVAPAQKGGWEPCACFTPQTNLLETCLN